MHCSKKFADVNYADDGQVYHTMDIYLPEKKAKKYPVVIHIYGSAWFNNNGKGNADLGTVCSALLNAGYAVVCPNHRSSGDAHWPAQIHDIKAVARYLRGNAGKYGLDSDFIAVSGFSSGGHLASLMGATSGTEAAVVADYKIDLEGNIGNYSDRSSSVDAVVSWSGPIDVEAMDCGGRPNGIKGSPEEALVGKPFSDETCGQYASISSPYYANAATRRYLVSMALQIKWFLTVRRNHGQRSIRLPVRHLSLLLSKVVDMALTCTQRKTLKE